MKERPRVELVCSFLVCTNKLHLRELFTRRTIVVVVVDLSTLKKYREEREKESRVKLWVWAFQEGIVDTPKIDWLQCL